MITMTAANIANMLPTNAARHAWIAAGMPTDPATVARIVTRTIRKPITVGRKPKFRFSKEVSR